MVINNKFAINIQNNNNKTNLAVNGTMDTGCSLGKQQEWVVATHPGNGNWVVSEHTLQTKWGG